MNLFTSLRYVIALHEQKHFGRAAQACHISQPALSNALRALEEEFGTPIVKRGRAFEGFTPEGELIFLSAQRMLHEYQLLQQDLKSVAGHPQGQLTIGAVPSVMPIAARFSALLQARHPGIKLVVRSMSSPDIEAGLENLSLDMGLGYTDRLVRRGIKFTAIPQYTERYFLLRRSARPSGGTLQIAATLPWREAAQAPLCLLTPEMHNRAIGDASFASAGMDVQPTIETDSILTLALSVVVGDVCSILPGALVGVMRGYGELEAAPLVDPEIVTPIGFMLAINDRPSHTLTAAIEFAHDPDWLRHAAAHSGLIEL